MWAFGFGDPSSTSCYHIYIVVGLLWCSIWIFSLFSELDILMGYKMDRYYTKLQETWVWRPFHPRKLAETHKCIWYLTETRFHLYKTCFLYEELVRTDGNAFPSCFLSWMRRFPSNKSLSLKKLANKVSFYPRISITNG